MDLTNKTIGQLCALMWSQACHDKMPSFSKCCCKLNWDAIAIPPDTKDHLGVLWLFSICW